MWEAKTNFAKLVLTETGEKNIKIALNVNNVDGTEYSYKTYVNGNVVKTGTTTQKVIDVYETETFFDVGIEEKNTYAEVEYYGQIVETNHVSKEDLKIKYKEELVAFSNNVNGGKTYSGKTITQIANIDLQGSENNKWVAIGTESNPFEGTYNGNNCTISNMYVNTTSSYQGLFGYNKGVIQNLIVSGSATTTKIDIGGITGYNLGEISNCTSNVIVTGYYNCGGISGTNSGNIISCSNQGQVEGTSINDTAGQVGGIAGVNNVGIIEKSKNTGKIISKTNCTGGITGANYKIINLCFNTGEVISNGENPTSGTGGIVGYQCVADALINNSYNIGNINGGIDVGGIIGNNEIGTIRNSYNIGKVTGIRTIGSIVGRNQFNGIINNSYCSNGTSTAMYGGNSGTIDSLSSFKSQTEMKSSSFVTRLNADGQIFKMDTNNINNGYPILNWQ